MTLASKIYTFVCQYRACLFLLIWLMANTSMGNPSSSACSYLLYQINSAQSPKDHTALDGVEFKLIRNFERLKNQYQETQVGEFIENVSAHLEDYSHSLYILNYSLKKDPEKVKRHTAKLENLETLLIKKQEQLLQLQITLKQINIMIEAGLSKISDYISVLNGRATQTTTTSQQNLSILIDHKNKIHAILTDLQSLKEEIADELRQLTSIQQQLDRIFTQSRRDPSNRFLRKPPNVRNVAENYSEPDVLDEDQMTLIFDNWIQNLSILDLSENTPSSTDEVFRKFVNISNGIDQIFRPDSNIRYQLDPSKFFELAYKLIEVDQIILRQINENPSLIPNLFKEINSPNTENWAPATNSIPWLLATPFDGKVYYPRGPVNLTNMLQWHRPRDTSEANDFMRRLRYFSQKMLSIYGAQIDLTNFYFSISNEETPQ